MFRGPARWRDGCIAWTRPKGGSRWRKRQATSANRVRRVSARSPSSSEDFGYRRSVRRFRYGGFQLGYCGPDVGVLVEWYPRDSLLVWLVRLTDGQFPPRSNPADLSVSLRYFDLADVEAVVAQPSEVDQRDLYSANAPAGWALAGSLRACATSILRGDLALIPALQQRIRYRVRQTQQPG